MKKIMVLVAAVAFSAIANAATFSWSVANVKEYGNPSVSASNYLAVYMIGTADSLSSLETQLLANNTTGVDLTYSKVTTNGAANGTKLGDLAIGESQSAFVVIFDAANLSDAQHFLVAQDASGNKVLEKKVGSTGTAISFAWGSQANNANWQTMAVPEPTSGLLLLLGMAGLALKRKHA